MCDRTLMELILPFCLRPLSDKVLNSLREGVSFNQLHSEILNSFIPLRVMERLKLQHLFRPQRALEGLSSYVSDIRVVSQVLCVGMAESQLVDLVLQGLNPEERSRLVFAPRPSSFADLERLILFSRSVQDGDFQRNQGMGHHPQPGPRPAVSALARQGAGNDNFRREAPTCFGCGQRGHLRSVCPNRRRNPNYPN